jgi:DNA-binding MarR family transcriptional regulator
MNASVIPLISLWEEFSTQNEKADLKKFAHWILQKEKDEVSENNKPEKKSELDDSAKAMLLISRLHRFMQMRSKPIIKKMGFTKDHEYNMLIQVYLLKTPNKKELAQNMLLENTTTVEITNRMLKKGLIKEMIDKEDKRSTRISLTAEGERKLYESYEYMKDLPATFLNDLTNEETSELVYILQKVEKRQMEFFSL